MIKVQLWLDQQIWEVVSFNLDSNGMQPNVVKEYKLMVEDLVFSLKSKPMFLELFLPIQYIFNNSAYDIRYLLLGNYCR
jgi:hypothetical protein